MGKDKKDVFEMTLREFIDYTKETNAGLAQLVVRKNDKPIYAIVAVVGEEECEELLSLLKQMKTVEQ